MTQTNGSPATLVATPELAKFAVDAMIRLADEGIPLKAIARITKCSSAHVLEVLDEALRAGAIIELPRADWPVGSARAARLPVMETIGPDSEAMIIHVMRCFTLTRLEAAIFLALIKRREVPREALHQVTLQWRRAADAPTDQKIVDVMLCKLRKKLVRFDLVIQTLWSYGYTMEPEHRKRAAAMIAAHIATLADAEKVAFQVVG